MKWTLLLTTLLLMVGCASPTVFLTTERLVENKRQKLIEELSENGFTVKTTSGVRIPEAFPDVVIATNPANENRKFFDKLEHVIRQQNFSPISYQKFYQQKHYYKGRNVGLYIRGDSPELSLPPVLRGNETTCNDKRIILEFTGESQIKIDVEAEEITSYTGRYDTELPDTVITELEELASPVIFKLSQVSVDTYAGMRKADKLVVTKSESDILPPGCEFMIIHY